MTGERVSWGIEEGGWMIICYFNKLKSLLKKGDPLAMATFYHKKSYWLILLSKHWLSIFLVTDF